MKYEIIFKGDFNELKDMGYEFKSYFASNYIGYTWMEEGSYDRGIIIWEKGKDISMLDECSHGIKLRVLDLIKSIGDIQQLRDICQYEVGNILSFKYNKKTNEILSKYRYKSERKNICDKYKGCTDFEYLDEIDETFGSFSVSKSEVERIKQLIDLDWIEIKYEEA